MTASESQLTENRDDIQGMLLSGYGHLEHLCILCLRFEEGTGIPEARRWIGELSELITTAAPWPDRSQKPPRATNVAFTYEGLAKLGLPEDALMNFSTEFQQDIDFGSRPEKLGDTGKSAPKNWKVGGNKPFDVMLVLYAISQEELDEHRQQQERLFREIPEVHVVFHQDGHRLPDFVEHFGFRDGISQPGVQGSGLPSRPGQVAVRPGEFILGYKNEYGYFPPTPTVRTEQDSQRVLHSSDFAGRKDFGRNGTYMVFRDLAQDVPRFWNYFEENARDEKEKELLAAKCIGRWKNGAPLVLSPDGPDPEFATPDRNNDFEYREKDFYGDRCPVSAHIRRGNPRDALSTRAPQLSRTISRRHFIIRRGMPYGNQWQPGENDEEERGLLFFAINTDIRRQFEFQQSQWSENETFNGLYRSKDPILGANDDGKGFVEMSWEPVRRRLTNVPRFVQVKGGAYMFLPSIRALKFLALLQT